LNLVRDLFLERRKLAAPTSLILGGLVGAGVAALLAKRGRWRESEADLESRLERQPVEKTHEVWPFVVILVGVGALLVLGPEYVYLRDTFSTRMNTVFKFYFATWILWGLAASFIATEFVSDRDTAIKKIRLLALLPLVLGFVYPLLATWTKTSGFDPAAGRTLDGTAFLENERPEDELAIDWINRNIDQGVIAEATGGSYTAYGRIATHTGLATILGWDFHEVQWRGDAAPQGSRRSDLERLYTTASWQEAQAILEQYQIDYVYIGPLERQTYQPLNERKFISFMDVLYENGAVTIYGRRGMGGG
jgi:uncharacterized membrane protein